MMGTYGLLVLFAFIGLGASTIRLNIASDGNNVRLTPQTSSGKVKTQWELRAGKGCKMAMRCYFNTHSCENALIKIDTGGAISQYCASVGSSFFNTSNKDIMSVTIENVGSTVGAHCDVKATESYIDHPQAHFDSSEHGMEKPTWKKTTCRCGWTNKSPARIIGGQQAGVNEFPFMALLISENSKSKIFCGGSIISKNHILSAAHCTHGYTKIVVRVGEHDIRTTKETKATQIIDVKKVIDHPNYKENTVENDITILVLKESIKFNNLVGPVCMPSSTSKSKNQQHLKNYYLKIIGWGLTNDFSQGGRPSPVLKKATVKVIDMKICNILFSVSDKSHKSQICTYNNDKSSCGGDSGGPLFRVDYLTNMYVKEALTSYGYNCIGTDPSVNTKVSNYIDWIEQVIKDNDPAEMCH
uniref:Venom S1 protease 46 n=1 Tax=Oncocephalus sp. TaxID=2944721 RepID=A0AB38ZES6_9HEMI